MTLILDPVSPTSNWLPWRSVWAARAVLVVALVAGVPPFLRMPPWCDTSLYDVAARNLLAGGAHYRDVFDTNLPGFVWALTAIRAAFGWGVEVLRAVDLLVVAGVVALLDQLARRCGATRPARTWAVAAAAVFYVFTPDLVHAQRDVWMAVPALAAALLRIRRLTGEVTRTFLPAVLEGALWGAAVWVKPHVVIPAAVVWLATVPWLGWRALVDLLGNVVGGAVVGGAGVAYLVASGTWPDFVEVFTFWNRGYAATMWAEFPGRRELQLHYFPPWSYLQLASVPVAVLYLLDARGTVSRVLPVGLWAPAHGDGIRIARVALAAVYLAWTAQALVLQRQFLYVHVPETLMLLAVLAGQRWSAGFLGCVWLAVTTAAVSAGLSSPQSEVLEYRDPDRWWAVRHPSADPERVALWANCWRVGLPEDEYRRRMTALGRMKGFHAANDWEQLGEVADWLKAHGAMSADVIAWHDAPHAVYLMLDGRPVFRFQHVTQMLWIGSEQEYAIRKELHAVRPRARFVVSDLLREGSDDPDRLPEPGEAGPDLLPPSLRLDVRAEFPYTVPAVFRTGGGTGRYVVHELRP